MRACRDASNAGSTARSFFRLLASSTSSFPSKAAAVAQCIDCFKLAASAAAAKSTKQQLPPQPTGALSKGSQGLQSFSK
jgi:hypothetical protein